MKMNWLKMIIKNETVVSAAKTLGKAVLYAALSTLGVGAFTGCSSAAPATRGQTTEIVAVGIPARPLATASRLGFASGRPYENRWFSSAHVAWISHSTMCETNAAGDTNGTAQVNPVVMGK